MTETLLHRGPDSSGLDFTEVGKAQLGLGHRRLAIIDLSAHGAQPKHYRHFSICFNGEIYNFEEVKAELTQRGHTFDSHSDTEMILHAYEEWGADCLQKFVGMFVIVLVDRTKQEVFCARDRAGVKPVFLYLHDGLFLFASELKAFHAHPGFEKKLNADAVAAFLQYGNVPTPHCIFAHCRKLRPGHWLKFSLLNPVSEIDDLEEVCYWNVYDAYNAPKLNLSYEEALRETEDILSKAFNYRMVADVPVGVFLSGGYDSACVSALLQKNRSEKLRTFTIGVPDIGLNEAPYARDVAAHLGTEHTELECTAREAMDLIPDLPFFYDEPFADSSAIPTTLVSKMARKEVTVALSADAGDEIFAGYNRYDYMVRFGKKLNSIPGFARHAASGMMGVIPSRHIPILRSKYNFHNRYEKLKLLLKDPSEENIMHKLSQQYTEAKLREVVSVPWQTLDTAYLSQELQANRTALSYMMAIDYQTYLVDDILQKVDRATMSQSLEGREPFLDQNIIEFAARLPDEFKYHQGVKKRILRDIVHQYIPKELMDRPKMGFAIPIGKWMMQELRDLVETQLSDERIRKEGILNPKFVQELKRDFFNGKLEYDTKIWYVLTFQMWYERWMVNR